LTDKAYSLGLIDETFYKDFCKEKEQIAYVIELFKGKYSSVELLHMFAGTIDPKEIFKKEPTINLSDRAMLTVQAHFMYEPYLKREELEVQRREQYRAMIIPATLVIKDLPGLSKELQEKLLKRNPVTLADAALIPGMTPAAISLLIFKIREIMKKTDYEKRILKDTI
jgi:tRNA uridine 5-carboxymethylaminomethyl modification enzyme